MSYSGVKLFHEKAIQGLFQKSLIKKIFIVLILHNRSHASGESYRIVLSPLQGQTIFCAKKLSLCQFNIEFALVVNLARLAYPWRWVLGCTTQILKKYLVPFVTFEKQK